MTTCVTIIRLRRLPRYCERMIGEYIKTLAEYVSNDYKRLKNAMKDEYRHWDQVQQMNSKAFLSTLKNKSQTDYEDVGPFCRQCATISKKLVEDGKLDSYTQRLWFMQGLPTPIQNELCFRVELNRESKGLVLF